PSVQSRAVQAEQVGGEPQILPCGQPRIDERPGGQHTQHPADLDAMDHRVQALHTDAPAVGARRPAASRTSVVFPAPLCPSRPRTSPTPTVSDTPSTATISSAPLRKVRVTAAHSIAVTDAPWIRPPLIRRDSTVLASEPARPREQPVQATPDPHHPAQPDRVPAALAQR